MPLRTVPIALLPSLLPSLIVLQITACAVTPAETDDSWQARGGAPYDNNLSSEAVVAPAYATALGDISLDTQVDIDPLDTYNTNVQYRLARTRVEAATGADLSPVALRIVDDSLIDREVSLETARLVDSQFVAPAFRAHFLDSVMAEQSGTYAALYSRNQSAIMVSRTLLTNLLDSVPGQDQVRESTLMALFIHELVHAADDARYDIQAQRTLSFRASFAQSATYEGHAQWLTRQICEEHACLAGLATLDAFMFDREPHLDHSLSAVQAISRNVLEYSYIEGERFITAIAARPAGNQLLEQLLDSPPRDPVQILAPLSFPDDDREVRNQRLIEAARIIDHPWTMAPWIAVESSPLKGINLREHPARRQAAVDGFTRLITAIVAVQFYDESSPDQAPKEATVIRATNAATASLFAQSLHDNTQSPEALLTSRPVDVANTSNAGTLYETRLMDPPMAEQDEPNAPRWQTAIAVSGQHVVQISGLVQQEDTLSQYVIAVLAELADKPADNLNDRPNEGPDDELQLSTSSR